MTDKNTNGRSGHAAFERALDTFGSDRTRWPLAVRRDLAQHVATAPDAEARLKEAAALDRLLDLAPPPKIDTGALAARILAAAAAETPAPAPRESVRPWTVFEKRRGQDAPWPAAALLAASLVLGMFFGLAGTFDQAVEPTYAEASFDADVDPGQIALDSDSISMFEGDLL